MSAVRTISLRRASAASMTFAVLLGVSVTVPMLRLPQLFTGTIVNAALLGAAVLLGPRAAVGIGILPSVFAVMSGQLPAPLAPLVPVIMVGNALLVVAFHVLRRRGWWLGVAAAAVVKSCWLFGATSLLVSSTGLFAAPVVPVALTMMGWPQLVTALSGGVIAYAASRSGRRL